jgi:hypothetical protein
LYVFSISAMLANFLTNLMFLDVSTLTVFGEAYKLSNGKDKVVPVLN